MTAMTANDILRVARGEIGVTESPAGSNRQKYGAAYGMNGVPWCVIFCWWCFREAGASALFYGGGKTASCSQYIAWAKKAGQWVTGDYKPGDLVFFDFNPRVGDGVDHIGIVESWDGKTLITIEGNTSMTSQDNGGAVMRRTDHGAYAVGAARPAYDSGRTPEKEEDGKMTGEEIYRALTEYLNGLPESEWSRQEGGFAQAVENGVTDGTYPRGYLTREQLFAVLNRLRLL